MREELLWGRGKFAFLDPHLSLSVQQWLDGGARDYTAIRRAVWVLRMERKLGVPRRPVWYDDEMTLQESAALRAAEEAAERAATLLAEEGRGGARLFHRFLRELV